MKLDELTAEDIINRPETTFIEYDGVLKHTLQRSLYLLGGKYYKDFLEILDMSTIKDITMDEAYLIASALTDNNPFRAFGRTEDVRNYANQLYAGFINHVVDDLFLELDNMEMVARLALIKRQRFNKTIYIYHPFYHPDIEDSLRLQFERLENVEFVYGDLEDVLDGLESKPTAYFLSSIETLTSVANTVDLTLTNVNLAKHRYNYLRNPEFVDGTDEFTPYILGVDIDKLFENTIVDFSEFDASGYSWKIF